MHADKMIDIKEAKAGEIFALFGVECDSGTTFVKNNEEKVTLQSIFVPDPVVSLSLKPNKKGAINNIKKALDKFRREDPTFQYTYDEESDQMVISGMGELHLQIYCERLKREFNI